MTINVFHISLAILFFLASSFFGLITLPIPVHDGILIISLGVLLFYSKELGKYTFYEDRYFHYFFMYSFIAALVMSYLNFNQPIVYSLRTARLLVIYIILIFTLNILLKNFQIKKAYPFIILVSVIIMFISFYVYFTGDTSMLSENTTVLKRLGEIRITIGTFTSIIFIFFLYHQIKEDKWLIFPLLGLLLTMVVVSKTRSVLFPILIIMLIPLLRGYKAQIIKVWMVFGVIFLISFMVSGYEKSILSPIINLFTLLVEESQTVKNSNVNIRGLELAYFWSFLDFKSIIFGYGMENILYKELYVSHFYLSDIGLFKIFYQHGIIGLFLYILMLWKLYKVSKMSDSALHLTGRSIVYFQILSPSSVFVYTPEYMFLLFVVYILVKNDNKSMLSNKIKKENE